MTLKIGRNDPCHCGSGKKYKKCHLAADEASEHERLAEEAAVRARWLAEEDALYRTPPVTPMPLPLMPDSLPNARVPALPSLLRKQTEEDSEEDAFREEFDAASYEDQVRILEQELAGNAPDPNRVFDMMDTIHKAAAERGERMYFRGLVDRVRGRLPEGLGKDIVWYHSWLIEDAVAEGHDDRLPALVEPLADNVVESIDEVFRLIDVLMYHNQVEPLVEMMLRAWPEVTDGDEIFAFIAAEFRTTLSTLIIYRHLSRGGAPDVEDLSLRDALAPLGEFDWPTVQGILDAVSGRVTRAWKPDDFVHGEHGHWNEPENYPIDDDDFIRDEDLDDLDGLTDEDLELDAGALAAIETGEDEDQIDELDDDLDEVDPVEERFEENLMILLFEWVGWMQREHGVPFARTEVARETLQNYILHRPGRPGKQVDLLPDKQSMDRQLAALASFLSGQYYKAGVLFSVLPSYIDFLESRRLAGPARARGARKRMLDLRAQMRRIISEATDDPLLNNAVIQAGRGQ
jgi:hypothetical protein